jgi:hypothetical protein
MQTILYTVAIYTAVVSLPALASSLPLGGFSHILTVLAIVIAWLLVGSGIAWAIGHASDLGETSGEQD